jgi:methyl coenzyme M reductase gamma subunit
MIRDPLTRKIAYNMYSVYLLNILTKPIDETIDIGKPLSFDDWLAKNEHVFKLKKYIEDFE